MIRPFHLRDLPLVYRLSDNGVSLHSEFALTNQPKLMRKALVSMIGMGQYPTYVWKDDSQRNAWGFVQLHLEDSSHAHIVHAALNEADADESLSVEEQQSRIWLPFLEQLTAETGRCGVHSLVAEVSETGPELLLLRQAGFAVYTRQDIWVLDEVRNVSTPLNLRPATSEDEWDIQLLYVNTVPRLVQLVEPMPAVTDSRYVLREGSMLAAFVHIYEGPAGSWLRLYIHPDAETQAADIIAAAVQQHPPLSKNPIYCCVRRYQSWLQNGLAQVGFEHFISQAVMVKHTVQRTQSALPDLATLMEKQGVKGSAPVIHPYQVNGQRRQHVLEPLQKQ